MIIPKTFDQILETQKAGQSDHQKQTALINWHVAKTGGTTLFRMIESSLKLQYVDMQNVEGWLSFQQEKSKFAGRNLVLEGHTWGSHTLFSDKDNYSVYYVTVLRDPLLRARSVFSYNKYNYNMQSALDDFFRNYSANPYVYHYGDGDIGLAKKRLEETVSLLFITERFEECVNLFTTLFDLNVENFTVKRIGPELKNT